MGTREVNGSESFIQPRLQAQAPTVQVVGMRDLLHSAPAGLRCTLDGRLLTDPVRSPDGHVFERSVLAQALAKRDGICPVTGKTLSLTDCHRDADLRRDALAWLRAQRESRAPHRRTGSGKS